MSGVFQGCEGVGVTGRWPAFIGSVDASTTELFLESCAAAGSADDVTKWVLGPFWDVEDWANFGA